jgi:nucleoid-associated protein YgaU
LPPAGGTGKTGTAVTGGAPAKAQDTLPSIAVKGIEVGTGGDKPIKVGGETKPPTEPRPAPAREAAPIVVGVKPSASVPPLSLPTAPAVRSAQPDVVSYDEVSYATAAGDTFRSISKAKYGTEAYGQALYLFNRSHPLAGDELLQSDALRAGQTVYIPEARILQSRYGGAIDGASSPGVAVGSTSRRADASAAAPRSYRVAAGGEKVYDIARALLGDGNRWVEIQALNPGWNWEVPLPPGVTLRVPADARLPQ